MELGCAFFILCSVSIGYEGISYSMLMCRKNVNWFAYFFHFCLPQFENSNNNPETFGRYLRINVNLSFPTILRAFRNTSFINGWSSMNEKVVKGIYNLLEKHKTFMDISGKKYLCIYLLPCTPKVPACDP